MLLLFDLFLPLRNLHPRYPGQTTGFLRQHFRHVTLLPGQIFFRRKSPPAGQYSVASASQNSVRRHSLHHQGESEGRAIQMGWKDRIDVLQWMNIANEIFGDSTQMVVHGISMGGATTMMVSGEKQQPYVKCFVEDCGYTSVWDEFSHELKSSFHLPAFPLMYTTSWLCEKKYGWNFKEASSLKQVEKCELPMLFIHGDKDTYVPTWMVYPLYEAKPEPKELWIVPGAAHALSYKENKQEYTDTGRDFVGRYIH